MAALALTPAVASPSESTQSNEVDSNSESVSAVQAAAAAAASEAATASALAERAATAELRGVRKETYGTYIGEMARGECHGYGVFTWNDHAIYRGQYNEGERHGVGVQFFPNGDIYAGNWQSGQRVGYGIWTYTNGRRYVGQFRYHQRYGIGILTAADGSITQQGYWRKDNFLSAEKQTDWNVAEAAVETAVTVAANAGVQSATIASKLGFSPNGKQPTVRDEYGSLYVGELKNGMFDGYGEIQLADGASYRGEWKKRRQHGRGVYCWGDGHVYSGDIHHGAFTGHGVTTFEGGSRFEGEHQDGKGHGLGILYRVDGTVKHRGWWRDGEFADHQS
jgi:hypothetical protein